MYKDRELSTLNIRMPQEVDRPLRLVAAVYDIPRSRLLLEAADFWLAQDPSERFYSPLQTWPSDKQLNIPASKELRQAMKAAAKIGAAAVSKFSVNRAFVSAATGWLNESPRGEAVIEPFVKRNLLVFRGLPYSKS